MNSPQQPSTNPSTALLTSRPIRREKRRQVAGSSNRSKTSGNALIFDAMRDCQKDPFELIALAVRLDEATGNRSFLTEPLETSSLLNSSGTLLQQALAYIARQKSFPPRAQSLTLNRAITPIILSGLILAQQGSNEDQAGDPNPSELLLFTMTMRKQALQRIDSRATNHRFRIWILIIAILGIGIGVFIYSIRSLLHTIQLLGFVGPNDPDLIACKDMELNSRLLCQTSEALTWYFLKNYLLHPFRNECIAIECPSESRQEITNFFGQIVNRKHDMDAWGHAPFAQHTVLTTNSRRKNRLIQQQHHPHHPHELQWLGDSILLQMIRQVILSARVSGNVFRILDVGCGVGAFFYAMLPGKFDNYGLDYEGLTFSPVETKAANSLFARHKLRADGQVFIQRDLAHLELPKNQRFDVIVCVEHILQVPNEQFQKMTKHLVMNGIVIIVTDVIHSSRVETNNTEDGTELIQKQRSNQSSWYTKDHLTHTELVGVLTEYGLTVQVTRDLGLEYSMPQLVDDYYQAPHWWKQLGFDHRHGLSRALRWLDGRVGSKHPTMNRLIKLWRQGIMIQLKDEKRRKAHEDGDLVYVMYIASKKARK